ncbi:hypothetical protein ACFQ73_20230 [Amycolatopsis japonica]|uniref:hypothetical protein n=1 Tax=Amycolatopsis japonica TaxID=208439 RepID=UPI0036704FA7
MTSPTAFRSTAVTRPTTIDGANRLLDLDNGRTPTGSNPPLRRYSRSTFDPQLALQGSLSHPPRSKQ